MSTNYYFCKRNQIKSIQEYNKEVLKNIDGNSIISREKMEDFLNKCLFDIISKKENHICKFSVGHRPSFQINEHYKNMDELIKYYYDNELDIYDEYLEQISWGDLIGKINKGIEDNEEEPGNHLCFVDEKGLHWYIEYFS